MSDSRPCRLFDGNSRGKVQNVRGDSSAKFLIRLAFELTIYTREYGIMSANAENSNSSLKKLTGANELQHKILGQIRPYLDDENEKAYPTDVFSQTVFQAAGYYGIASDLITAIQYAQQKIPKVGPGGSGQNSQSPTDRP